MTPVVAALCGGRPQTGVRHGRTRQEVASAHAGECKQVSAYVLFDKETDAAVLYIDMGLGWVENFAPTNLGIQTLFDEEGLKNNTQVNSPQMVSVGTTLHMNR